MVVFEVQGFSVENEHPLIKESVVSRPQDFPAAGLVIELPVCASIVLSSCLGGYEMGFLQLSGFSVCR